MWGVSHAASRPRVTTNVDTPSSDALRSVLISQVYTIRLQTHAVGPWSGSRRAGELDDAEPGLVLDLVELPGGVLRHHPAAGQHVPDVDPGTSVVGGVGV